jgi:hypothetical protein
MFTDAVGKTHFEFREGVQLDGKTFKSLPLFNVCQEFGTAQVRQACIDLGCYPYAEDLKSIKSECQRQEDFYV